MNAVGFIYARGGSKGLPGKNTRLLCGKPLIAWAIEQAWAVPRIRRVIVSTDSPDIANVALDFGAEVPFLRPEELARDDVPEWLAWRHGLEWLRQDEGGLPEAMVSVPATAPLRLAEDIDACLSEYENESADVVVTVSAAHRNPYFNIVRLDGAGYAQPVISVGSIHRRQDAPTVYDMATVAYVARPEFVLQETRLFAGKVRIVHVPTERSIDIDTLLDFEIAEFLMTRRKNNLL